MNFTLNLFFKVLKIRNINASDYLAFFIKINDEEL